MPELIRALQHEHANIAEVLGVLRQELAVFDHAGQPDYEIFQAIAEYFLGFPERCHHPKEDLLLGRMKERNPAWYRAAVDLDAEHRDLTRLTQDFSQAVRNVLNDAEVSRSAFHHVATNFIERQDQHMKFEEQVLFPAALAVLTPEDWLYLDRNIVDTTDPVFGGKVGEGFEDLKKRVLQWEKDAAEVRAAAQHEGD